MNEFAQMVLSELRSGISEAIAACFLAAMCITAYYFYHKRKYGSQRKFPWLRTFLILLFAGYLVIIHYATVGRLSGSGVSGVNLRLFRGWMEAWYSFSVKAWLNLLLNIGMFLPLGVLLPLIWKPFRKWQLTFCAGLGISLFLELSQLLGGCGILDADDLFANTLGAMMGFFALRAVLSLLGSTGSRLRLFLGNAAAALIPAFAIGGIFLAYQLQDYGNLPDTPIFRANTDRVEFSLECGLPETGDTAPVYFTQPMTQEACDRFGSEFGVLAQADFHEILYYDRETYFIDRGMGGNGAHFLLVSWLDGSYEYSHVQNGYHDPEILWEQSHREQLESLLAAYSVTVPAQAEFTYDGDGWHTFRADHLTDETGMLNGTLRCRFGSDRLWEIENHLIHYRLYRTESILTPAQAMDLLQQGWFSGGDTFDYYAPENVSIVSFRLDHRVDTKGFFQPVYLITLSGDGYTDCVMIPARIK